MSLSKALLPQQVLQWHLQKSQMSCAASGMEMILKSHGLIPLDDFSLQTKYGDLNIGFEQAHELESRGLQASTTSMLVPDLLSHIESEILQGRFPLVSLPVHRDQNGIYFHIFVAEPNNGLIQILDPATGQRITAEKAGLATAFGYMLRGVGLPIDYRLDCLTYQTSELEQ